MADGGSPLWGVAPHRQKKVPWTTLTSLSASRQVSTVQEAFSFYTQDCYPFLFVFLHNGFLSLVLSSFYTNDCYPLSFPLFTHRIVTLRPFIFLHKGFLSLVLSSFYTKDCYSWYFRLFTQRIVTLCPFIFLHK